MTTSQKLLFTDADSLMYEIKTEDVYEDFSSNKEIFILVIIQLSQNTIIIQKNWSLEKLNLKPETLQLKNLFN